MWTRRWLDTGERVAFLAVSGLVLLGALHIQGEMTRHLVEAVVLSVMFIGLQELSPRPAAHAPSTEGPMSSVTDDINAIVKRCWQETPCPSDKDKEAR